MVHTLPDFTGNGGTQVLSATSIKCNWIQFTVPTNAAGTSGTNSAPVRVGDLNTGAARGTQVTLFGMLFPSLSDSTNLDLALIYFYAASNDKLLVTYGKL